MIMFTILSISMQAAALDWFARRLDGERQASANQSANKFPRTSILLLPVRTRGANQVRMT
jgi:hypothetical protein